MTMEQREKAVEAWREMANAFHDLLRRQPEMPKVKVLPNGDLGGYKGEFVNDALGEPDE